MQAVVFEGPQRIEVKDVPAPRCGDGEVLLRVRRAGICGTDVHIYRNEYMSEFPLVPGHELVGEVIQTGRGVARFAPGDRVAVDPNLYCNQCDFCRNRQFNHCLNWQGVGITRPGAFAEQVAVPAAACYAVPEHLSDAEAAMIEPVSCVVHAMNRLEIKPGDAALLLGVGPMGLLLVQALRHRGVGELTAVDQQRDRLHMATKMGATRAILAGPDQATALRDAAPHGYDVVVDATGVPAVVEQALSYLRPYGRYLQFGVTPRGATVALRPYDLFRYDWTLLGSFALCYTFEQAIAWMASGVIDAKPVVSTRARLADFPQVFEDFMQGRTLKVQVEA